ncbi:TPA: ThiF family adenylyltransferase [Clostridium botulinum]|uniref:Ubiquitin-activating enzyme E1-like protein n=1 Tax=Clostridium botulinum TaxID=1491 RepID=A0A126JIZ2_CLOBO|nr:ThiF family adenylyltransferase [Clostridium botulinum]ALT05654.1 ubiquitin-activating enzyme E1-like protein [Clostridium botulinum]ALT05756.1 ubiquitin-activating enzyme E1-like protein [Clostridium botulinum]ALT05858.1 ubiquitin-activating enzyme E1-like protein [Clostridium botulinum]HBJ2623047.1 ThiF family adenylyltransferase [Clostridium botulinum]
MYTVIIIGCGATGSNLITLLSQYSISEKKIKNIVLVDGDNVESKNFRNQKFTMKDVNENKARVLSNRYSKLGIDISYVPEYISDTEKLINLIKSYDNVILVGAVDNNNARQHMHKAFIEERIQSLIYIDTGNGDGDGDNRLGQTVCGAKYKGKIVKPPVADIYPQILETEKEKDKIEYHCSQIEEHPQNFVVNVISATVTFTMINNIVSLGKVKKSIVKFNADNISVE